MTQTDDPRPLFDRAADQGLKLIRGTAPDQLDLPTPCTEFDVRALLGHMVSVLRRITHVASGGNALDVPRVTQGIDPDAWGEVASRARDEFEAVWADDAVLDRMFTLPFGTLPGRAALLAFTQELTQHAWDLAKATGRIAELDPQLAEIVLELAQRFLPAEPRGGHIPFAPVVDVPADADPYTRLAGWLGRDPR
jgi:uncharacterized protein (TIGR03086 family)